MGYQIQAEGKEKRDRDVPRSVGFAMTIFEGFSTVFRQFSLEQIALVVVIRIV
jgi:hypothetical protein